MVVDQRKDAIVALYKGCAALDPIAAVVICDVAELADRCAMDMAAKDGIHPVALRIMRHSSFEFADKAHRIFHAPLSISAERPVAEAEAAPDKVDEGIEREQKLVTEIASECEPLNVLYHGVEFVAMDHQNSFPGCGHVNCPLFDLDVTVGPAKVAHQLVVISRDVDHVRAFAGFAQNFLDHVVVLLRPKNSAAQRPDIDQVAHDVQSIEIVFAQKIE